MAAIIAAEVWTTYVDVLTGVVFHAVMAVMLLTHAALRGEDAWASATRVTGKVSSQEAAYAALSLIPLVRIISLTMPFGGIDRVYQFAFVGVPILVATISAARLVPQTAWKEFLRLPGAWMMQASIGAAGVPLALVAYAIERPEPLVDTTDRARFAVAVVVLVVFVGFGEELLFRGVLQRAVAGSFGRGGYVVTSGLFATAYLAAGSLFYVGFAAAFGVAFAWLVGRTGSLVGVVVAHALMAVGALLVCPVVLS